MSPSQRQALELVADGRFYPCLVKEDDGWHARWHAIGSDNYWVDEYVREATVTRLSEDAEDQKHETLHDAWMLALRSRTGLVRWDEDECARFAAELEEWSGNAEEDREARSGITFELVPGADEDAKFKLRCQTPRGRRALKALGQATYVWPSLTGLAAIDGNWLELPLVCTEADDFIRTGALHLRDAGYSVKGVDLAAQITAEAVIDSGDTGELSALNGSAMPLKLTVRIAGEEVGADEIRFLLDQGSSLVYFRDHWIEVDRGMLKEALRALEKGAGKGTSVLGFALGIGHIGNLDIAEVRAHGWLRGLVNELREAGKLDSLGKLKKVKDLNGELRDYQKRGVEWLNFLTGHGFGALLADDMGLGKTIQIIGWLLVNRKRLQRTLVVAPLTLLSNWRHELARFAPSLKVYVHQGYGRHVASGFRREVGLCDVTIVSYNLLVKDYTYFSEIEWDAMVLDEAQAIKNPDTQMARAVRALTPPNRIAITGTPIENSVADIWSIEEFLNPGFLGDRKSFRDRFVKPITDDMRSAAGRRLQHALEPFVLRRLKSDGRIAAELGKKHEIREYCELTPEQRREYENALAEFRSREHESGDVFALLTRLKLICDGQGKLERLAELLENIFANGESALIFTQYAKVGTWLQNELVARFGRKFPFLHGGLSAVAREQQIAAFQNTRRPNLFILSLKAGGFGLNLTKATHVIHFDRWWNPAVENQATDRAHRIGQTKTVFVHLFISAGTVEEHVDELLARKAMIAGSVVTEAEWLEAVRLDG